ncbi:hypothetical protein JPSP9_25680 [Staphylococcus pseudintermedius]
MNKLHNFITIFLIIISLTIIISSIFLNNENLKTTINIFMLFLIIILALISLIVRFMNDKKSK